MCGQILIKAFNLMSKSGVRYISMRQIAQACGVSKPVLYYYFKDKDDLIFELIKQRIKQYNDDVCALIQAHATLEVLLEHLFATFIKDFSSVPGAADFALHFHSYLHANPAMQKRLASLKDEHHDNIETFVMAEIKKGRIQKSATDVLRHLINAVLAHLILNAHDKTQTFNNDFLRQMSRAILKAVSYKEGIK